MTFDYDLIPPGYYDFRESGLRHRWHHCEFLTVEYYVRKTVPSVVIDLGCGPGVFLRNYCKSVEKKIGFDISKKQIKYANTFSSNNLVFCDSLESTLRQIEITELEEGFSACITGIELIEHVSGSDMQSMVERIKDLLRSKGATKISLVLTTPNKRSLWPLVERTIDLLLRTNYREQHISIMNYHEFERITELVSGSKVSTVFSFMSIPQWLFFKPPCSPIKQLMLRGMLMLAYVEESN